MMIIYMRIAFAFNNKFEEAMPGKELQHVVKKWNCRINATAGSIIQVHCELNIRFRCFTDNPSFSSHICLPQLNNFVQGINSLPGNLHFIE